MSTIAIFELDSPLSIDEVRSKLYGIGLPLEVTELTQADLEDADVSQSKRIEVYVRVYESTDEEAAIVGKLQHIAEQLLELSDGELYFYRSSHAQEKDADVERITVPEIATVPPTLHEPHPKRYVFRRD